MSKLPRYFSIQMISSQGTPVTVRFTLEDGEFYTVWIGGTKMGRFHYQLCSPALIAELVG